MFEKWPHPVGAKIKMNFHVSLDFHGMANEGLRRKNWKTNDLESFVTLPTGIFHCFCICTIHASTYY